MFDTRKKIGVLGGGQLGRMLLQASIDLGLDLHVMDTKDCPCENIVPHFVEGNITDFEQVLNFGKNLDILTIEIENVNIEALEELERRGVKVYPQAKVIKLIQDKGLQKEFYERIKVETAPYHLISSTKEIEGLIDFLPAMQKLRKGGYDGKGVQAILDRNEVGKAFDAPSVLEKFVDLEKELSVIISRNEKGEISCFPIVEQEFNSEANLVEFLFSPADIENELALKAEKIAQKIIEELDMIGLLAIEFFLDKSGNLLVNEIAPRPHNSGHQTIEGNITSQFQQHLRCISGLPLGSTDTIQPSVMINLLGEKDSEGEASYIGLAESMKLEGVYPHIYGKKMSKPFRKMGHVTIINKDLKTAKKIALNVKETIQVVGK
jgi:5-(carboxyamino)imidazole ribonucleotide synthase